MVRATEILRHEHRFIERMLAVLDKACSRLEEGGEVPPRIFEQALDFIKVFADSCHHAKEEASLFPLLEERGIPKERGPLGVMIHEHEEGRRLVTGLNEAITKSDRTAIIENARDYIHLLQHHIWKEDEILFPWADRVLSSQDQKALVDQLEEVEMEVAGCEVYAAYEKLIEEMGKEVGLGE